MIVPVLIGVIALIGVLFLSVPSAIAHPSAQVAPAAQTAQPVVIYFFWGDGCPHCAAAKPVLAELTRKYPGAQVRAYEVWYVEENQTLFKQMAAAYGFEPSAVPTIFIGDRHWVGYAEQIAPEIESAVAECAATGCRDAGMGIIPGIPTPAPTPIPTVLAAPAVAVAAPGAASAPPSAPPSVAPVQPESATQLVLPWFGAIDLAVSSLAVSTALIALVDGFNPCSLWVLSVLLALTLNSGSRRKVFLVGFVFLAVTSLVYMAFITGLFTMFTVISFVGWIQIMVALVALFFAAVNIKDYFWYKEGISLTIADEQKPGIYRGMRRILNAGDSNWGVVGATVVLAAGVSLVEFSCTAGFPVLWTNLLIAQQATALTFGLLLLLYMLIYQLDELAILLVAVFTLKASKLEEKQGRVLKLIGGMLMLTLAMVMLVNPAWMSQISSSLIVFGVAFVGTLLVLLVHRKILPRFGIRIGTELAPATRKHGRKHPRQPAAR
jgi:cytochrome c biogenesis protein CcdA/thiol-disulfide isomerase/thioredoxin